MDRLGIESAAPIVVTDNADAAIANEIDSRMVAPADRDAARAPLKQSPAATVSTASTSKAGNQTPVLASSLKATPTLTHRNDSGPEAPSVTQSDRPFNCISWILNLSI